MIKQVFRLLTVSSVILLAACQSSGRYAQHHDSAPSSGHDQLNMQDATPRYEPYKPFNSRAYEVLGKRYYPMQTGKGFTQEGYASWYGQKFHGHLTSNGETYNMFAMTAAHKTLPLPSFVRVTNLDNGRTTVVRVNDRGPFHSDRIIDLSYAAAIRLGYQKHGTARVRLEVIHFDENNNVTVGNQPTVSYAEYAGLTPPATAVSEPAVSPAPAATTQAIASADKTPDIASEPGSKQETFIQVAALSDLQRAQSVSDVLSALYQVPAQIPFIDNIYKLRLGPLKDRFQVQMLLDELKNNGYPNAYMVSESL